MTRGSDMDSVVLRGSGNNFKMSDVVTMLEYPSRNGKDSWVTVRLFGPVYSDAFFWVKAKRGSQKSFRVPCRCYDPETHQCVPEKYDPWYDEYRRECDTMDRGDRLIQYTREFYMQGIVRKLEDNMPAKNRLTPQEKKTGFKDMDSDSYTPVVVVRLTQKLFKAIQEFKEDNVVKLKSGTRKAYNVNDPKFGRDIMLKKNTEAGVSPGDIYQVKLAIDGGRTPITEEQEAYLKWDMETIYAPEVSDAQVKQDFESWARRMGLNDAFESADPEDDDTDDFEAPKVKKSSKKVVEDDDLEDDDTEDFEDDDEDEKPSKKKSKKVVEEDDDFDDEDEEEEKPVKKLKKSFKKVEEDDEFEDDDDFDDDFDDDEEEESPKKSKKKVVEEEDDDDFDDEDEEEEKPVKKLKKSTKVTSKKKSKKKVVEEEDDDFDDDDEDNF